MIVQITMTRDELFLLKEMLPIWKEYTDAFIFMVDNSTDGTYEYLIENSKKYNILSVLTVDRNSQKLIVESDIRQQLYDEAIKYSNKIICLDTDEYLDGSYKKQQLESIMDSNKDTLFYAHWIQYVGKNHIRKDGKWNYHPVDRIASYAKKENFKPRQMHSEHLPLPSHTAMFAPHELFVAHLQWIDKKSVGIKQYYWKIEDYVNKTKFGADVINPKEYDASVNDFSWKPIIFGYPLKIRSDIYNDIDWSNNYKYRFIKESIAKYNIPNLNDWGLNIHG